MRMFNIFYVMILSLILSCSIIHKQNTELEEKNPSCKLIIPKDSISQKIIEKTPLDYYQKQKSKLTDYSKITDLPIEVKKTKLYIGRFDCGIIELTVTNIGGDHGYYLYGVIDEKNEEYTELSFLVNGEISDEELDRIKYGNKYKIHWIETIVNLEPFEEGYKRLFVVYKIE